MILLVAQAVLINPSHVYESTRIKKVPKLQETSLLNRSRSTKAKFDAELRLIYSQRYG
jgi:hypothetical protein